MKQYLDNLNKILSEGVDHIDRTGTGRRSIYGLQNRYNLNDGFPLITTRKCGTSIFIKELLWFISGSTSTKDLDCSIWKQWAVNEDNIKDFCSEHSGGDKQLENIMNDSLKSDMLNSIGPMYGAAWRSVPRPFVHTLWPVRKWLDIPIKKLEAFTAEYNLAAKSAETTEEKLEVTLQQFCERRYLEDIDQLNELVCNLKERPYSSRHVVVNWIPANIPFESVDPQTNVLMHLGALAPCHMMFQCFVTPPLEEGGKKRLSLLMYQR